MALAMHIQILQERGFSNSATDDELPKVAQRMALYLPIRTTGAFTGIGAVYADAFLIGSMILCRYLVTALKGMAD
jgi:hypothetical protein